MTKKRIVVSGCCGKMGQFVCRYIQNHENFSLVGGVDPHKAGKDLGIETAQESLNIPILESLAEAVDKNTVDAVIDFTIPAVVVENAKTVLKAGVSILIGTTGIGEADRKMLEELSLANDCSVFIVPNFAIGAILMMEFAQKAAKYMPDAEIIELHHPQKLDKPSGTALLTRRVMLETIGKSEDSDAIPTHSVRLPGMVAHQQVIFGGIGQTLTIRHDSLSRESFMPGVGLALEQLFTFKGLRVGLKL